VLVKIDMHIGVVCAPVGEIDRQEGDFAQNGQYQAYLLDTTWTCKQLSVGVEGVCWFRLICKLGWGMARLARLISGRGISP